MREIKKNIFFALSFRVPYEEFKEDDPDEFKRRLRISVELFDELLSGIEVDIAKQVSYHCSVIFII